MIKSVSLIFWGFSLLSSTFAFVDLGAVDRREQWSKPDINASSFYASPQLLDIPNLGSESLNWQNKFKFNPLINVNTNRGNLKTSIPLNLPPNLLGLKSFSLNYNSQNFQNNGYGIGWRLNVPKIIKSSGMIGNKRSFKLSGLLGEFEFIPVEETASDFKDRIEIKGTVFRPVMDSRYHVLIQAKDKIVLLDTNGLNWIFNTVGQLVKVEKAQKSIDFNWESGVLQQISSAKEDWVVRFNYLEKNKYPVFKYQKFRTLPIGLKNIQLKAGLNERNIKFSYDGEYLEFALYENSHIPLFMGAYKNYKNHVTTESNNLNRSDKSSLFYFDNFNHVEKQNLVTDKLTYRVDLTGDGRADKIEVDLAPLYKRIKHELGNIEYEVEGTSASSCQAIPNVSSTSLVNKFQGYQSNLKIQYAHASNDYVQLLRETQLSKLKLNLVNINFKKKSKKTSECHKVYYYEPIVTFNRLYFVDFNGDNLRDVLLCPNVNFSKKEFYKALINNPNSLPSLQRGELFLQKINKEKLEERYAYYLNSNQESIDNINYWSSSQSNYRCNQFTEIIDLNQDGQVDLLTGDKVGFIASDGSSMYETALTKHQLHKVYNLNKIGSLKDYSNISLLNLNEKLSPEEVHSILNNPQTGKLELYKYGETLKIEMSPRVKLLNKFYSPFGGKKVITYSFQAGQWVVKEIHAKEKRTFFYDTPMRDDKFGIHTGFYQTREKIDYNHSSRPGKTIKRTFYKDVHPSTVLYKSRARVNGMPLTEEVWDLTEEKIFSRTIHNLHYTELSSNRALVFNAINENKTFDENGEKLFTVSRNEKKVSNWIEFNGEKTVPLTITNILNDEIKGESHFELSRYHLQLKAYQKDNVKSEFSYLNNLLVERKTGTRWDRFEYDELGRRIRSYSNNGFEKTVVYTGSSIFPSKYINSQTTLRTSFDHVSGDMLDILDHRGKHINYKYDSNGILLHVARNGTVVFDLKLPNKRSCDENNYQCLDNEFSYQLKGNNYHVTLNDYGIIEKTRYLYNGRILENQASEKNGGLDITLYNPRYGNKSSLPEILKENEYDVLGRLVKTIEYGKNRKELFYSYVDACRLTYFENRLIYKKCSNTQGKVSDIISPQEDVNFRYESGKLIQVAPYGIEYQYNQYGELISSNSHEYPRFNETIQYSADGLRVSYEDDYAAFDSYGRFLENSFSKQIYNDDLLAQTQIDIKGERFTRTYQYDDYARLNKIRDDKIQKKFTYDSFDRINKEQTIFNSRQSLNLEFEYQDDALKAIQPFIVNIIYDEFKRIVGVEYRNGVSLSIKRDLDGKILDITYLNSSSQKVYQNIAEYNNFGQVVSDIQRSNFSFKEFKFEYDDNKLVIDSIATPKRDEKSQVLNKDFIYERNNLSQTEDVFHFYDASGSLFKSCRNKCFSMHLNDEITLGNDHAKLIKSDGLSLGAVINGKFYVTLTDYKGSVTGLMTPKNVLFVRHFDSWGNKNLKFLPSLSDKQLRVVKLLDKILVWSFAGLIENPLVSAPCQLYWSKSRVYSPDLREWLTMDPLVKYKPEILLNKPGNWNGVSYASNDPVNFVDPSGHYSQELQAIINASWGRNEPQRAMNAVNQAAKTFGSIAAGGAAVGAIATVGPLLLAAAAPKVAGLTLVTTIEYNAAMIGVGQFVARNPQKVESFINNSIDFIDNFSGALGCMTTGTPPETPGGHAGFILGTVISELNDNFNSGSFSESFNSSFSDSWWNQ